jgi:hypothetical protein
MIGPLAEAVNLSMINLRDSKYTLTYSKKGALFALIMRLSIDNSLAGIPPKSHSAHT